MSNTLICEVGKSYRDGFGKVHKIYKRSETPSNPHYKYIVWSEQEEAWFGNGWKHGKIRGKSDLIEEVKENEMKIEVGKYYKTRSGHKAFVAFEYNSVNHFTHGGVVYGEQNAYDVTISWHPLGNHLQSTFENDFDLIEEWKEPKSGVAYLNVYKDDTTDYAYMNRTMADDAARDVVRLACVRVEWKEGQFDD